MQAFAEPDFTYYTSPNAIGWSIREIPEPAGSEALQGNEFVLLTDFFHCCWKS